MSPSKLGWTVQDKNNKDNGENRVKTKALRNKIRKLACGLDKNKVFRSLDTRVRECERSSAMFPTSFLINASRNTLTVVRKGKQRYVCVCVHRPSLHVHAVWSTFLHMCDLCTRLLFKMNMQCVCQSFLLGLISIFWKTSLQLIIADVFHKHYCWNLLWEVFVSAFWQWE